MGPTSVVESVFVKSEPIKQENNTFQQEYEGVARAMAGIWMYVLIVIHACTKGLMNAGKHANQEAKQPTE